MDEQFDRSRLELIFDHASQYHVLHERNTEEKVLPGSGDWKLNFDDNAVGYICDQASGRSVWCDSEDCLQYAVLRDPDDATQILVFFVDAQQDDLLISLDEFRHRFTSKVIKFTSLGTNKTEDVKCFILDAPRYGAAVVWSVTSLYDTVMPGIAQTASRWYLNWWLWWKRRL